MLGSFKKIFLCTKFCTFRAVLSSYLTKSLTLFFVQDVFRLLTPGGGGFGRPDDEDDDDNGPPRRRRKIDPIASQHYHEKGSVYAYRLAQESA